MRGHPTALLAGLLVAACAETVRRPPLPPVDWPSLQVRSVQDAGMPKATERERALSDLYPKALASPGFTQLRSLLDEDAHFAFGSKDTRGQERVVTAHDEVLGAFDERRFVTTRVWLTDSSQALEWTMTGVHTRAWMGLPATGRPVAVRGLTLLWTKDDGSISDVHLYFDQAVVKAELGNGPPELRKLPPPAMPIAAPQVFERRGGPEEAANVTPMRAMLQALEDNNPSAYASTMANDIEVFTLDSARPARGKDASERPFRMMRKSIGDLDTVVHNAWGVQQFAVVEYSIGGLQLAPLGRIPFAPNRLFHTQVVDIAEIRNGKITRVWRYDDSGALASAMELEK